MMGIWIVCGAIFGVVFGSFLNVAAIRLPQGGSVVYPPSRCMSCGHRLKAADLFPVVSYLGLRGRCRYCKTRFSSAYLWGELATGLCFALFIWRVGVRPELAPGLLFASMLIAVTLTDLRYMLIPDRILWPALAGGIMLRLFIHALPYWNYALAFIVGGGILYAAAWLGWKKTGQTVMGGGDIKLLAIIGLYSGVQQTLLTLFLSSLLGVLTGIGLRWTGRLRQGQAIPFGPFITLGAIIAYLWGDDLFFLYNRWMVEWLNIWLGTTV